MADTQNPVSPDPEDHAHQTLDPAGIPKGSDLGHGLGGAAPAAAGASTATQIIEPPPTDRKEDGLLETATIDFLSEVTHLPLGTGKRVAIMATRWFRAQPHVCTSREALYSQGDRFLGMAERQIVSVSTIKSEEPSTDPLGIIRDYSISLHRQLYANRFNRDSQSITHFRFVDLADALKCDEAMSMVAFGKDVHIFDAKLPIECLIVDGARTLIGFPHGNQLSAGIYIHEHRGVAKNMLEWVNQSARTPYAKLSDFPRHDLRHGPNCLCNLLQLTNADDPATMSSCAFDKCADYYELIYKHIDESDVYTALARRLKGVIDDARHRLSRPHQLRLLDVGCAMGFGAEPLTQHFAYTGIDSSPAMIKGAPRLTHGHFYEADAIAALMGLDSRLKRDLPDRFDIIACQGNSFDCFLGTTQKMLALRLFDQRLNPGGLLVFSGKQFDHNVKLVRRACHWMGEARNFVYKFDWKGNFYELKVCEEKENGSQVEHTSLIQHQAEFEWREKAVLALQPGYKQVIFEPNWRGPRTGTDTGSEDHYELVVYQKPMGGR